MTGKRRGRVTKSELEQVRQTYEASRPQYEAFADALRVLTTQLCKAEQLPVDNVTARAKETASVVAKMRNRSYRDLEQMVDKCGVRVITRYESTVERVCELLSREFDVIESVEHGFEAPQTFGYTSRHLIVRLNSSRSGLAEWAEFSPLTAEIQVRSILQHAWASISHSLDYKTDSDVPDAVRRRLYRVAALLETGDELFNAYQREAEELVASYQTEAAGAEWHDLPIDLESLQATASRFDWESVEAVAVDAGWRSEDDHPGGFPRNSDAEEWRISLSRLVDLATEAGLKRVGEVARYVEDMAARRTALAEIAAAGDKAGFVPWAYGPDIAGLLIVRDHADRFKTRDAELDWHFVDELWIAALGESGGVL